MFNKIFNQKNNYNMKEMKALAALKGKAAADVTAEDIAAVNAELQEAGITAIEAASTGTVAGLTSALNSAQADFATATTKAENATAELATAQNRITALEAENAALKPAPAADAEHTPEGDEPDKETPETVEPTEAEAATARLFAEAEKHLL